MTSWRAEGAEAPSLRSAICDAAGAVRRYLYGLCGNWHQAEDLAQEALLRAWAKRESFNGRSTARTWLFTIARNYWRDTLRRRRVRPKEEPMGPEASTAKVAPSPADAASRGEFAAALGRAVSGLPDDQREALALRESEGLTFREIGDVLGVPTATAKSRVRYALLKLAEELKAFRTELEP